MHCHAVPRRHETKQVLTKLAEETQRSVPYATRLKGLKRDRERLESSTFSSAAVPDAEYKNYVAEGLFKLDGFSSAKIEADLRFRVMESLAAKGLHKSAYAGEVMLSMGGAAMARRNLGVHLGTEC